MATQEEFPRKEDDKKLEAQPNKRVLRRERERLLLISPKKGPRIGTKAPWTRTGKERVQIPRGGILRKISDKVVSAPTGLPLSPASDSDTATATEDGDDSEIIEDSNNNDALKNRAGSNNPLIYRGESSYHGSHGTVLCSPMGEERTDSYAIKVSIPPWVSVVPKVMNLKDMLKDHDLLVSSLDIHHLIHLGEYYQAGNIRRFHYNWNCLTSDRGNSQTWPKT